MTERADVVIVGGGVNGASIAYHLGRRAYGKIIVLEKNDLATGSTAKSAGIVRQHYTNPLIIQMAIESRQFFETFQDEVGGHPGFVQNGFLLFVAEPEVDALQMNVASQRELGLPVEILQPEDVAAYFPGLNMEGVALASYEPSSGYADPHGVAIAFAERARSMGVDFHIGRQATGVRLQAEKVCGIGTDQGDIETPVVVNAAGPWGNRLARSIGVDLPLQVKRLQELFVKPAESYSKYNPTVIDLDKLIYMKPDAGGLVMIGGGITEDHSAIDPDRYDEQVRFETVLDITERAADRMPVLADAAYVRGVAGVITVTPDFHPILGEAPEAKGFIHAMSCNGHGFKLSPVVGRLISELIADGQTSLDISPLHPDRFERGEMLSSRYAAFPILA